MVDGAVCLSVEIRGSLTPKKRRYASAAVLIRHQHTKIRAHIINSTKLHKAEDPREVDACHWDKEESVIRNKAVVTMLK